MTAADPHHRIHGYPPIEFLTTAYVITPAIPATTPKITFLDTCRETDAISSYEISRMFVPFSSTRVKRLSVTWETRPFSFVVSSNVTVTGVFLLVDEIVFLISVRFWSLSVFPPGCTCSCGSPANADGTPEDNVTGRQLRWRLVSGTSLAFSFTFVIRKFKRKVLSVRLCYARESGLPKGEPLTQTSIEAFSGRFALLLRNEL